MSFDDNTALAAIRRKCEQYWNEPAPEAPEFHAILAFIHEQALTAEEERSFCDSLDDSIIRRLRAKLEKIEREKCQGRGGK